MLTTRISTFDNVAAWSLNFLVSAWHTDVSSDGIVAMMRTLPLLLATGALGALAATWSVAGTVLLLGLAGLAGAWMSLRWQEVSG